MTSLSRAQVREKLDLNESPDDELMELLEEVGTEEIVTGVSPVTGKGWSPEEIRKEVLKG